MGLLLAGSHPFFSFVPYVSRRFHSGGQEFEIRYVALRNITLIIQRFPDLLTTQIKIFFVKYNDPIYIKLEKLDIMLALVVPTTVDVCLSEFLEYASEVDVEFVRKSVRAIGRTAIKIDCATQKCIDVLLQLIKTKINYVVQEGIIVIKDIFRKYPNQVSHLARTNPQGVLLVSEHETPSWVVMSSNIMQ